MAVCGRIHCVGNGGDLCFVSSGYDQDRSGQSHMWGVWPWAVRGVHIELCGVFAWDIREWNRDLNL